MCELSAKLRFKSFSFSFFLPQKKVNDKATNLPATLDGGKIQITRHEGRIVLQTDFGLQVTYDDDWAVMVAVPSSYFGATCGLCGNFNEDTEDEATLPDGTRAATLEDWAESWQDPSCQDDCGDQEDAAGCGELILGGSPNILGEKEGGSTWGPGRGDACEIPPAPPR
ncbi:hypothetical protein llap_22387 [Limosa lapponica baueri]|uniref:VWFD domain-containing protein n=1 Tax=Limosa lapponica baueri TaxID=1758121 RepID=A0A2I0T0J1_LIMLA|nr:hypothetical protein llap_22387 [Limosa lapponica baueri]